MVPIEEYSLMVKKKSQHISMDLSEILRHEVGRVEGYVTPSENISKR